MGLTLSLRLRLLLLTLAALLPTVAVLAYVQINIRESRTLEVRAPGRYEVHAPMLDAGPGAPALIAGRGARFEGALVVAAEHHLFGLRQGRAGQLG